MNYFNKLPSEFSLDHIRNRMLLKSNIIDFNHNHNNHNNHNNDNKNSNISTMFNLNKQASKQQMCKENSGLNHRENVRKYTRDNQYFYPKEKDTLFWCYYINKSGIDAYLDNKPKNFTIEHDFKINTIEKIGVLKDSLKVYKIKKTKVEDELMTSQKIGITTLKLFMMLDNTNVMIFKTYCYQEIIFDLDRTDITVDNYTIIFSDGDNYYIKKHITDDELRGMISKRYKIDNFEKPLKGISSYKVDELHDICRQLDINILNPNSGKNKTKQVIYTEIMEKFI